MTGQLERIVELRSLENSLPSSGSNNIIAFTAGKGGAGKTVISLNIAYRLSRIGKKVLFVDLDLNFSNAHIMLNLAVSKNLKNYFEGNSLLKNILLPVESNLYVIPGFSGWTESGQFSSNKINSLLTELKGLSLNFDYIILDTGQLNNSVQLQILLNAKSVIIVTTPEPTAVMDAYVVVKLLKKNNSGSIKQVVVNKSSDKDEAMLTFNNLNTATEHFLNEKLRFAGYINFSEFIHKSIVEQKLFLKEFSDETVKQQIITLSASITEFIQMANIEQMNSEKTSK